jgi:CRP-like cAMP-binding protein
MNILTEEQASARQLQLTDDGLLTDVPAAFIHELQLNGTFIEYNQQVIAPAGQPFDYVICIITGQANLSRPNENYSKTRLGSLVRGQWFGEANLFVRAPSRDELFAAGEVIVWSIATETLRNLLLTRFEGVQLLFNFAVLLAQKLVVQQDQTIAITTTPT